MKIFLRSGVNYLKAKRVEESGTRTRLQRTRAIEIRQLAQPAAEPVTRLRRHVGCARAPPSPGRTSQYPFLSDGEPRFTRHRAIEGGLRR
jgi:hypothetical protein